MTVYVVTETYSNDESSVIGVYSTKEIASGVWHSLVELQSHGGAPDSCEYDIEMFILDELHSRKIDTVAIAAAYIAMRKVPL